jgi:CRP/FNR family cyclic AMP-dependent transcriptional regulator
MAKKHNPPFDPKAILARAGKGQTITKYKKNQVVFKQGDPADAVFYIQTGKVKVSVVSDRGKEAVVSILGRNDFFGEGCLSGQPLRIATVDAMAESVVVRIQKEKMVQLLHKEPLFSEMFVSHLLNRIMRVEADLIDQLFNSSERRLARLLLVLANYGNAGNPEPILAKISQQTLAEMIGTTRPRVNFFMNRFRKLGFIKYNSHIEVHR